MKLKFKMTALALMSLSGVSSAYAEECGDVAIADMNWNSASLIANIDRFILEHGYGCDAELVPGDTMPTGTSMIEKGQPDVAPELWSNSLKTALDKGVEEGRLRYAGKAFVESENSDGTDIHQMAGDFQDQVPAIRYDFHVYSDLVEDLCIISNVLL